MQKLCFTRLRQKQKHTCNNNQFWAIKRKCIPKYRERRKEGWSPTKISRVWHLTREVRNEVWWRAGLQGCMHLEEGWQGRQHCPGPRGEYTAHSVNPARKSSWKGQRREARSNTSEEEPRGREAESFGLNEISINPQKFFNEPFLPKLLT